MTATPLLIKDTYTICLECANIGQNGFGQRLTDSAKINQLTEIFMANIGNVGVDVLQHTPHYYRAKEEPTSKIQLNVCVDSGLMKHTLTPKSLQSILDIFNEILPPSKSSEVTCIITLRCVVLKSSPLIAIPSHFKVYSRFRMPKDHDRKFFTKKHKNAIMALFMKNMGLLTVNVLTNRYIIMEIDAIQASYPTLALRVRIDSGLAQYVFPPVDLDTVCGIFAQALPPASESVAVINWTLQLVPRETPSESQ
jgi:hypothetical protein